MGVTTEEQMTNLLQAPDQDQTKKLFFDKQQNYSIYILPIITNLRFHLIIFVWSSILTIRVVNILYLIRNSSFSSLNFYIKSIITSLSYNSSPRIITTGNSASHLNNVVSQILTIMEISGTLTQRVCESYSRLLL